MRALQSLVVVQAIVLVVLFAAWSQRISVRDGEAKLRLAAGRYMLRCTGAGGASVAIDTRTLGPSPLVVRLEPEATVQIDSSSLDGPTRLVLRTSDGVAVFDRWVTWTGRWERALLPGRYLVTTTTLDGATKTQSIDVTAEGALLTM